MTMKCLRCAEPFELRRPEDIHCLRCVREVAAIIEADTERRERRVFAVPKDLSGLRGIVL